MKRVLRFATANILGVALLAAAMPLQAATHNSDNPWQSNGGARYQSDLSQGRDNGHRGNDRGNRGYRGDDHRDWDRGGGAVYATPAYPAPDYYANGYAYPDGGYYYVDPHGGQTAALVGGGMAAGAVIGAAAGHGEGAAIGAVIGGITGAIASHAIQRHDYR